MSSPDGSSFKSYADVIKLENRRKDLLARAKKAKGLKSLVVYRGTLLPDIICCPSFWMSLTLYTIIRIVSRLKILPWLSWPQLTLAQLATLGGFVTFTLVFFVSQAYGRYLELYRLATSFDARVSDAILMIRSCMPEDRAWRIWRYMHAAHALAYVGLSGGTVYGRETFFAALNDQYKLLTKTEMDCINKINDFQTGGLATREIIAWIFDEINDFFVNLPSNSPFARSNNLWSDLNGQVTQIRGALGGLFGYSNMPIPFIYQHLVHSNTRIYLLMFAYSMGVAPVVAQEDEIASAAVVIFMGTFVIGLRELGLTFMDPFGTELEDFNVLNFVTASIENSRRLLLAERRSERDAWTELDLNAQRPGPGNPWIHQQTSKEMGMEKPVAMLEI